MIRIRAAHAEEAEALAQAHHEADWEAYAPLFGDRAKRIDAAATLQRWRDALAGGDIVLAALEGEAVIGVAHIRSEVLRALYLRASHWRRGIGRRLLQRAVAAARSRGVAELRFNVVETNARAIAFYESFGARRCARTLQRDADGDEWWDFEYLLAL